MNVFVLVEEFEQSFFLNKRGEPASPFSSIVGIYADKEKAEHEKRSFEEYGKDNNLHSYLIEERPLL